MASPMQGQYIGWQAQQKELIKGHLHCRTRLHASAHRLPICTLAAIQLVNRGNKQIQGLP